MVKKSLLLQDLGNCLIHTNDNPTFKWLEDVELIGTTVTLIPMSMIHRNALVEAASDGKLWELWFTSVPCEENIDDYILHALKQKEIGKALPFVVKENKSNKIIGSTRFCNVEPNNRRLEIGYTWYSKSFQRMGINTECKFLLLSHAFESLSSIAVEFRTHWHNTASRNAIANLGAKQDGVLRNRRKYPDGTYKDSVVFSIIDSEWGTVKKSLEFKLRKIN